MSRRAGRIGITGRRGRYQSPEALGILIDCGSHFVKNALCGEATTQILSTDSTGVSRKSFVGQGPTRVP